MTLTPDDVRNKHFKAAFRGYAEEEVDTFLDEVEVELSRLIGENDTLRQRIEVLQSAPPPPQQPVHSEAEEMLRRTLLLAQRTADETVAEARADAQRMVEEARQQAESTIQQAEAQAAASIDDLERRRQALEQHIDGLRAFEREYRTRLKAYLESQLRDLDGRAGAPEGGESSPATAGGSMPSFGGGAGAPGGGSGATAPADAPEPVRAPAPAPVPVAPTPTSFAQTPFTSPPQAGSYDVDEGDSDVPRLAP